MTCFPHRFHVVRLLRPPTMAGLRSDSLRQPPAAPAMLLVRPVHLSRSSAMRAVNALPPDRVVRTAVLQLANPGREPFFQGGENQPPSLASAFFPSGRKSVAACVWTAVRGPRSERPELAAVAPGQLSDPARGSHRSSGRVRAAGVYRLREPGGCWYHGGIRGATRGALSEAAARRPTAADAPRSRKRSEEEPAAKN
ncbi:hypothetical protein MTO96_020733 [Rhipicephalus appendiculatus]